MACCNNGCCNCGRRPNRMDCCTIKPVSGCPKNCRHCTWYPIEVTEEARPMRFCCDQNGLCGMFPEECRNTFWPDFSHPRWLCCKDLYCARRANRCC